MSEKVIQSFEIIETDEGFRIELKGDKELLRKMLLEGGRPFNMPFGRGFGGHGPFEHLREMHERHHQQHGRGHHEHPHPPFEGREAPNPEEMQNQHFFFQRHFHGDPRVEALRSAGRNWKFKRGGYDMGPWWEDAAPDEPPTVQL